MPGLLLDTNALYWLASGEIPLSDAALVEIGANQATGTLFVSPVSAWELSVATQKARAAARPNLGDIAPDIWFKEAIRAIDAIVVPIKQRISLEAAKVVVETGHKDPGDCFLMATARVKKIPIVTSDGIMQAIAQANPDYLSVIAC